MIDSLLTGVGQAHPQALIYPLSVASRSTSEARKKAAANILDRMRTQYNALVEEALSISAELIRVAILWPEMWHEGLEEASRLYFTERDPEGMIAVLEPLHAQLERVRFTALGHSLDFTPLPSHREQAPLAKSRSCKHLVNNSPKPGNIPEITKPMAIREI